jgi:hypothetical protein
MEGRGEVFIYNNEQGNTRIEVRLENDTLWLSQRLISGLFQKDTDTIGLHIRNIYSEGELSEETTSEIFSVVQQEGKRNVKRDVKFYNLDVILSVGYRISSKRGTDFRIWANSVLKEYLTQGYAIDKKKFQDQSRQLDELKQTVKLLGNVITNKPLNSDEAVGLLKVVTDYTYALDILDRYDHQVLEIESTTSKELFQMSYEAAMEVIRGLRDKFGGSALFREERYSISDRRLKANS